MPKYTALPVHSGVGVVHLNRFRISVKPPTNRAVVAQIGDHLMAGLLKYMDPATATVRLGDHKWNGNQTLKFTGVAKIRPFSVPIPVPGVPLKIPIPGFIRDWAMPDVHTDSVGVVSKNKTGFTVQTLKRDYEDNDDKTIRKAVGAIKWLGIAGGVVGARQLTAALANIAVFINQHHFLSGRRAFRVDWGNQFDYTDDRVVFETVAIERFTNEIFAKSTVAMGDAKTIIRRVWVGMLTRFAKIHGFTVINEAARPGWKVESGVHYLQANLAYSQGAAIAAHPQYGNMSEEHAKLVPTR